MPIVVPSPSDVTLRLAVQGICFLIAGFPYVYFHLIEGDLTPTLRGFYCDDENLKHPYKEVISIFKITCAFKISISIEGKSSNGLGFRHLVCSRGGNGNSHRISG